MIRSSDGYASVWQRRPIWVSGAGRGSASGVVRVPVPYPDRDLPQSPRLCHQPTGSCDTAGCESGITATRSTRPAVCSATTDKPGHPTSRSDRRRRWTRRGSHRAETEAGTDPRSLLGPSTGAWFQSWTRRPPDVARLTSSLCSQRARTNSSRERSRRAPGRVKHGRRNPDGATPVRFSRRAQRTATTRATSATPSRFDRLEGASETERDEAWKRITTVAEGGRRRSRRSRLARVVPGQQANKR